MLCSRFWLTKDTILLLLQFVLGQLHIRHIFPGLLITILLIDKKLPIA